MMVSGFVLILLGTIFRHSIMLNNIVALILSPMLFGSIILGIIDLAISKGRKILSIINIILNILFFIAMIVIAIYFNSVGI